MIDGGRRRGATLLASLVLLTAVPAAARAQEVSCDPGDTEVRALSFRGNRTFSDAALAAAVVTTPSASIHRTRLGRAVLGWAFARRCIDRSEIVLDRARLVLFYRNHGFPDVAVDTAVKRNGRAIEVRFDITEGRPIRVAQVAVNWTDSVPGAARIARNLPMREGRPFDKLALAATRDTILTRLGNAGYPWAQVLASYETYIDEYRATAAFDVIPGPRTRLGRIDIAVTPRRGDRQQIPDDVARKLLGIEPGDLYRDRDLAAARRNLYVTEAYQNVVIERDSAVARTGADSLVNLRVSMLEGYMRAARVSAGYGTIDCVRAQGDLTKRDFEAFGLASRLEVSARVSKIGVGEPTRSDNFRRAVCGQLTADPYSSRLNYFTGVTLRQPVLTGVSSIFRTPTFTLFSQRQSEYKAFLRTVPIGFVASVAWSRNPRLPQSASYQIERGKTEAQPAVFCAVFNACQAADRDPLQKTIRTATLGYSITRSRGDDPLNPRRGSVARLDLRHASNLILSDSRIQFNKGIGDMAWYRPGGFGNVIALRARVGGVIGGRISLDSITTPSFVPQQERLFAGGAQTVRGYHQNELGPLVYVASQYDSVVGSVAGADTTYYYHATQPDEGALVSRTIPTGGNVLLVGNVEYRMRSPVLPDLVQVVAFADVGNVWDRRVSEQQTLGEFLGDLKVTPGAGVRIASPFGPIRLDVGYNWNDLAKGEVYFEGGVASGAERPLLCVTPGNTVPVTRVNGVLQQATDVSCPGTYRPPKRRGGLRRLNVSIALGQAF